MDIAQSSDTQTVSKKIVFNKIIKPIQPVIDIMAQKRLVALDKQLKNIISNERCLTLDTINIGRQIASLKIKLEEVSNKRKERKKKITTSSKKQQKPKMKK